MYVRKYVAIFFPIVKIVSVCLLSSSQVEGNMENILPALITGVLALIGVIITNISSNKTIENKLSIAQAVTDTKLDNLTDEVKKHNNFAQRIPVVEVQIEELTKRVEALEKRKLG